MKKQIMGITLGLAMMGGMASTSYAALTPKPRGTPLENVGKDGGKVDLVNGCLPCAVVAVAAVLYNLYGNNTPPSGPVYGDPAMQEAAQSSFDRP